MSRKIILFLMVPLILVCARLADAQQAIFFVRHAEQSSETEDPELTDVGKKRAKALASVLKDVGINVIYTTERKRAIETAEPIAKSLNIETKKLPLRDLEGLIGRLRTQHPHDRVLVVNHSLTIPRLLKALGHPVEVTMPLDEYDNLFVLIPKNEGSPTVLRLRY